MTDNYRRAEWVMDELDVLSDAIQLHERLADEHAGCTCYTRSHTSMAHLLSWRAAAYRAELAAAGWSVFHGDFR